MMLPLFAQTAVTLDLSRPMDLTRAIAPELILCAGAMILLLYAAWRPESEAHQRLVGFGSMVVTIITLISVLVVSVSGWSAGAGPVAVDGFRWAADVIFLLATLIAIGLSMDYNAREGITAPESHVLVLFATVGMMIMAGARDLMVLFLGLETMSVSVYVLVGMNRRSARSAEGALKYFLLGAFSTAFLLYGIALVYGATGSTNLSEIGGRISALSLGDSPMLLVGVALLLVGFAFKMAAAPFHMWAPDVYEGAPTPITGYMAAAVKAAAFAAFFRVWIEGFGHIYVAWHDALWWLAVVTMFVGNLVALQQRNLKRMLAYSSIGHTGFLLVAITSATSQSPSAMLFYLFAYTLATMGAFAVIVSLGSGDNPRERVEDYHGLWQEQPSLAIAMTVFMLAMLGFPVFGGMGFFAKWYVLQTAIDAAAPQVRLAVMLVLATTISAGYYLYVVMVMFMKPRPDMAPPLPRVGGMSRAVILASVVLLLVFGLFPDPVVRWARAGTELTPAMAPAAALPTSSQ
ncbi:MAG TPA: NADH-quinone oxidoreductase subunit N [Gemmatimonadaceae bacterium]|nr:NADH-quinone oxidoreductase subunit N [Gemmatimonadaceae bacterium]